MAEGLILNLAFACSLAAAAAGAAGYVLRRPDYSRFAPPALLLAWGALTAALALLWLQLGRAPLLGQYETLLAWLWLLLAVAFYYYRATGRRETLTSAAFACSLLFALSYLTDKTSRPLPPELSGFWAAAAALASMAAYACFALAAAAAARALLKRQSDLFEELLLRLARLGFALLAAGLAAGAVWAGTTYGRWWSWSPAETWPLITWLAYAAALHLRRRGWGGHRFAILVSVCFGLVLFTYFGVNVLLAGLRA
jgi:ABC-type transport system involved in cytochrome c biogenesis permease subunit